MQSILAPGTKKLGFGLMRLPVTGDSSEQIDITMFEKMVDAFLERGFTYFDTAYFYHGGRSESAAGEALVRRHPRDSFTLTSKLPVYTLKKKEDMQRIFDEQLQKTGAGYFDYYLLHSLTDPTIPVSEELDAWSFVREQKEKGLVKHWGFSFHSTADVLDRLLTAHPDTEFVQLQINYADWESEDIQSRRCYEVARRHQKPVIVMEPVKGGSLATIAPGIAAPFRAAAPDASVASWAVRWCASLEGVMMVLSGMSNMDQLMDNTGYMRDFSPLTKAECQVVSTVAEELAKVPQVPCTGCKYCTEVCPQKIPIPSYLSIWNEYLKFENTAAFAGDYHGISKKHSLASECLGCGACEKNCPQHLPIIETLRLIAGKGE